MMILRQRKGNNLDVEGDTLYQGHWLRVERKGRKKNGKTF